MIKSSLFVDLLDAPYSRRGSFLAFANDNHGEDLYGKCTLWLCNCRISSYDMSKSNGFRQVKLELVKDGTVLPCVISTTPYEVILESVWGSVRFCIGERKLVMCRGTDGLTLRITPTMSFLSPGSINLMEDSGARMFDFGPARLVLLPFTGKLTQSNPVYMEMSPDENGVLQLGFEEYMVDPLHRPMDQYPSYEDCVNSVKADFEDFCARIMPSLPAKYESARRQALWQTWSMMVEPDGEASYKRTMVKMIHCIFEAAFLWQQPMQAVWLSRDVNLAWEIFCSAFDYQDVNGRPYDGLSYRAAPSIGMKPPIHGGVLLWMMENLDLSGIRTESKVWLWERMVKWTDFFRIHRDRDRDGLVEYQNIVETGWEDAPYFNVGFPCACPGLNASLALQMEAVAKLGREIGRPEEEYKLWMSRSEELTSKIVEKFWDGERWFAFNAETGQQSDSHTISLYTALFLGKRLPQDIIDKSITFMYGPDGFDTPYGLASEGLTSKYFKHGFTSGSIIVPVQFLMILSLEACGRGDLAKDAANKYCAILRDHGFFHIHNALTGHEDRSLTAYAERGLFWSAWASSCYFYLADKYGR
ncbi:MAG: hypothetical protein GX111_01560 [Clostridiales bacterium]|nr:hypothetical protein [Clostridiales bacterium]